MVSLQRSDSMLALLILLFLWTTCSAQPHDPTTFKLSALHRAKRDLPTGSRDRADKILNTVKDSLSLFKEVMEKLSDKKDTVTKVTKVITSLRNFASLAPGIGALASSIISVVLIFIPEDNTVLNELREGFSEMNRKLDSLSSRISNLATDVEWFNYASVYSQDEVRILQTWKKFSQFFTTFYQSEEEKQKLSRIFIRYYENAGTEISVDNFYHYLTVSSTSLSGNLNNLLRKKFKCDINEISKYNLYFSSLMWKGLLLNDFYWKLIGVNSTGKEAEHTQMLRSIYKAQISTVDYCLNNYEKYMSEDVAEIAKALSPDNKQTIAEEVKKALDKKYNWYNWVVLVYEEKYTMNLDMTTVTVGKINVSVGYTTLDQQPNEGVDDVAKKCFKEKMSCDKLKEIIQQCEGYIKYSKFGGAVKAFLKDNVKVTHVIYGENHVEVPQPFHHAVCVYEHPDWYKSAEAKISMYYSKKEPVCEGTICENGGTCNRLLDSNEWQCNCPEGYYGERCEVTETNVKRN